MDTKTLDQKITDIILTQTFTQQQLVRRVRLLKEYVEGELFQSEPINLNSLTSNSSDINWLKSLPTDFFRLFTKQDATRLIEQLERFGTDQKPLLIYVPFEMPEDEIPKLGSWLRSNYGNTFLYELKYDPSLLAGCSLVWGGLHKDYSAKKSIEDHKEEIIKEINTFVRH